MLPSLFDHLWQSTIFAGVVWVMTLALRNNRARVRHGLWIAASCKFLIPLSLLIALGGRIEWRKAPVITQSNVFVISEVSEPFTAEVSPPFLATVPPAPSSLPAVLLGIWTCGFLALAWKWGREWTRIHANVRTATPLDLGLSVPARSSTARFEPGVFGVFRPILLLPEGIFDRLTPAQLKTVIAHELCHVRHRDNLVAAIHMFVETVFWFHPLVWWIGKRMVEERELACDEEVLRDLGEPKAYAEGILNVCKLYVESPLECVSGVSGGSNLKKRIEAIMSNRVVLNLNFGKKLLLAAAGMLAASGPIFVGLAKAQSQGPVAFEVASIRPHIFPKGTFGFGSGRPEIKGNKVTSEHTTILGLLMFAYGVKDYQIIGATSRESPWSDFYDIVAKTPGDDAPTEDDARRMMQGLLADRFQVKLHRESKKLPVYDLVVGKNGPKMKEHVGAIPPIEPPRVSGELVEFKFVNRTIHDLLGVISPRLDLPVLDKTSLMGSYDFAFEFSISNEKRDPGAEAPIFTVVQEQLGLKLVEAKEPMEILVIDSAQRPSGN
jgi:bla regulator protein blaR1